MVVMIVISFISFPKCFDREGHLEQFQQNIDEETQFFEVLTAI